MEDEADIEGLLAYALYKTHKRNWEAGLRLKADGQEPGDATEAGFVSAASTADQLLRYKKSAQEMLLGFAEEYLDTQRRAIGESAITERMERAAEKVESASSFRQLLSVGVASTLITTAFVALLAFGAQYFGIDLVDALSAGSVEPK